MQKLITGQSLRTSDCQVLSPPLKLRNIVKEGQKKKEQEAEDWVGGCEPEPSGQDRAIDPRNSHSCGYLHEAYTSLSLSKFHSACRRTSPDPHGLEEFPIVNG